MFIFDRDRKLQYAGRLDDSPYAELSSVTVFDARNALDSLLAGKPVAVAMMTKPFGCATKWMENKAAIAKVNEKWESTPVTVEKIDSAGIAALVKNDTQQLRLIQCLGYLVRSVCRRVSQLGDAHTPVSEPKF